MTGLDDDPLPSEVMEEQAIKALDKKDFERALVYSNLAVANAIREGVERILDFEDEEDDEDEQDDEDGN